MKKQLLFSFIILISTVLTYGNEWINISSQTPEAAEVNLIVSDNQSSRVSFLVPGFEFIEVNTSEGTAFTLQLEDASPLLEEGAPDLLKLTTSLVIPDMAGMDVRVLSSDYTDYENILIAPSKGNLTRDINPENVAYIFGETYSQNSFFPGKLAELRNPYIVRDYRGQTIVVYPFQYNPISRVLRVYHSMEVEVFKVDDHGVNPLIREKMPESIAIEFDALYQKHFLNNPSNIADYTPVSEHGNMLIISYGAFMPAMQDLIDWRIQTGTPVEMVDVASIGGSAQIKNYIANYYNSNGLTFVLLVGDAAQVPSSYSSGDSDNNYAYIVGNDHYPDVFIGRFSAENIGHVETQVERTLTYEKTPDLNFDWFSRGIGIASDQGPGDDNEYDYVHIRNIHTDLLDFTYTYCAELFDGSQGGNDASGNPTPSMVAAEVNTGATIINYTGHGSNNAWSSSGFSSSDVNNLSNTTMWPFIWAVACVNGNFVSGNCFAEAWLRATDNGIPTGAVATLMSTINQSWDPPMCGQDEMDDVLVESYPNNINRKFGPASMHGCMQMNDEYGSSGDEMTDTWVCFGDPSLHMRTAFPQAITASYMTTIFVGMNSLSVTADAEGGTVCITKDGNILATEIIQGGSALLTFPEQSIPCQLTLTITGFNFLPHIGMVDVVPGNTPFLVYEEDHVIDPNGNNNGFLDFGESVTYTIDIYNLGGTDATDVDVTLTTLDPYITLIDNSEVYTLIPAGQTVGVDEGFAFEAAANIPDMHKIDFTVTATDADTTWIMEYQTEAHAPVLNIAEMIVDDNASGNGNGRLDPGESAILKVKNFNSGHCPAENTTASLTSACQYLTFTSNTSSIGTLGVLGFSWATFDVEVDADAPDGAAIAVFDYELVSGEFIETTTFNKKIGLIVEDWETGDFTKFEWDLDGDEPFEITNIYPFEGTFSAKSGSINDNQESELSIDVEVMLADSVTFFYKISSQTNKDKLKFYINNTLQGEWSGISSTWTKASFAVNPGNYTFKWIYEKDASGMSGNDCAWVDYITFPPLMTLTCYAGHDDYTCDGDNYQCQGEATEWVSVEWTSSGDGSFDDPYILNPIYLPGTDDVSTGSVTLTIAAENTDGDVVDDDMILTLSTAPESPMQPQGPDYVNVYNVVSSEYTVEAVPFTDNYVWQVEPNDAGDFAGMGIIGTITWNQSFLGIATISVQAVNSCGESVFSEGFDVTVDNFTAINEVEDDFTFAIYPNPGNGNFSIVSGISAADANIRIYNMLGKVVYEHQTNITTGENLNIGIENSGKGLYILSIIAGDERYTEKLIIK